MIGSEFERKVWQATKKITKGKVATYAQIARAIGCPKAARAVGNALNKNPYAPSVPCHRVIRSDGRLGGYAGGVKKKKEMLEKEGFKIEGFIVKKIKIFLEGKK